MTSDQPTDRDAASEQPVRRPSPGPTSRARRASGAAAETARRRPSPGPVATAPARPRHEEPAEPIPEKPAEPAESTEPTEPEPIEPETPTGLDARPPERRRSVLLAAALVVVIAALGTLSWVLFSTRDDSGSTTLRDQALAAAKTSVPVILSYNYTHFGTDVTAGKAKLTGRASSDYVTAMTKTIQPTAAKVKAVVQAQTDGAGVESVAPGGKQVTVIVFGEQKVSNTALSAPRTDLFRVRATLDLVGKQWLVSKFDQI